jgi:hypothetical protein
MKLYRWRGTQISHGVKWWVETDKWFMAISDTHTDVFTTRRNAYLLDNVRGALHAERVWELVLETEGNA